MDTQAETRSTNLAADALEALGEAWRGDWSDFDGRMLMHQADEIAATIRKGGMTRREYAAFMAGNSICSRCRSWEQHCRCDEPSR